MLNSLDNLEPSNSLSLIFYVKNSLKWSSACWKAFTFILLLKLKYFMKSHKVQAYKKHNFEGQS